MAYAEALAKAAGDSLSNRDFDRLARLIDQVTGIKMPRTKQSMVEGRLRRRVAATGAGSFDTYCDRLFAMEPDEPEMAEFINAITTNKTDFFREPEHFRILADSVLPQLCEAGRRPVFWSAACSSGAEPYTLAMVIKDFALSQQTGTKLPPVSILATDISTQMLETARLGIYPLDMITPVPEKMRTRYLMRARDRTARTVRIVPELRAMVRFGYLNLMSPDYAVARDMDVIFCRNVLIYFDRAGQKGVLLRLLRHLRPGGTLVLGHSESITGFDLPVQQIGHSMFRRV